MKPARLAVLGIALLAGGAAAMLASTSNTPPPPPAPAEPAPAMKTVDVLVAAVDVPTGHRLNPGDARWQPWPADSAPNGSIQRPQAPAALEENVGSIVRGSFLAGEPLRREKLLKADGGGYMSAVLPAGMRAVAISIDTRGATSAGGFVLPNDRVDVLRTFRDDEGSKAGGTDVQRSETLLTNIRVLAIGQNVQDKAGEKIVTGETATLEVTPVQAEILTLGQKVGQLSLALRSLADANQPEQPRDDRGESGLTIVRYGIPKQAPRR